MNGLSDITFGSPDLVSNPLLSPNAQRRYTDVDAYVRDGVYAGVKVAEDCRDRLIPKDTDLGDVFRPVSDVSVYCLDIYPQSPDIETYQQIMQEVYTGDAFIDSIDKHPTDKGFVILLVINRAKMVFRKDTYKELFPTIGTKDGGNI